MAHIKDGQGDRQAAIQLYQQSVDIYRHSGDLWAITHPLKDLAWHTWDQGQIIQAREFMEEYLNTFRQVKSLGSTAWLLGDLTYMAAEMGDYAAAYQFADDLKRIKRTISLPKEQHYIDHHVAYVDFMAGNLLQARQKMEKEIKAARKNNDQGALTNALSLLGRIACYDGHPEEGRLALEECLNLVEREKNLESNLLHAEILLFLGNALNLLGEHTRAVELLKSGLEMRGLSSMPVFPGVYEKLARAALHLSQSVRAASLLGAADHLRQVMGLPIPLVEQGVHAESLKMLGTQLDVKAKDEAWQAGAAMSVEQSLAFALAEVQARPEQ